MESKKGYFIDIVNGKVETAEEHDAKVRADEREKVCNELLNRQILIIDDEGNMHTVVRIKYIHELINKE